MNDTDRYEEQLWVYLPKEVARQFTPKEHIILDPAHEDGLRSNLDCFPIEYPRTMTHSAWTQEGITTSAVTTKWDYTSMIKHDSSVGGRGPSDAECAFGAIIKDIAESDFPFIELDEWLKDGTASYAYFKEPIQLPEGVDLQHWESRRSVLKRMPFSRRYRDGWNEDRVGYIIRSSREDLLTNTHEVVA